MTPLPPKSIRFAALLISGLCLLSALGGVVLGFIGRSWFFLGFEVVAVAACAIGVMAGLGRVREGAALTMLITGGCLVVGAALSEPTLVARVLQGGRGGGRGTVVAGVPLLPVVLARIGAGCAMALLAALTVFSRRPGRSLGYLARGVAFGVPLALLAGAALVGPARAWVLGLPGPALAMLGFVAFLVVGALLSISVHNLIRAVEVGIEDEAAPGGVGSGKAGVAPGSRG